MSMKSLWLAWLYQFLRGKIERQYRSLQVDKFLTLVLDP